MSHFANEALSFIPYNINYVIATLPFYRCHTKICEIGKVQLFKLFQKLSK